MPSVYEPDGKGRKELGEEIASPLHLENFIEIAEILIENLPFERLRMAGYTPAASPKYTKGELSDERASGI